MKKILTVCLGIIAIALLNVTTFAKIKTINFCTIPYPPFVITDKNNQLTEGFDIDLANTMCKIIGAKCKFTMQRKLTAIIGTLNSGECDAWIRGYTISPGREKYIDFTNSYYPSGVTLIVPKNSTIKTSNPSDLKGKKIGATDGSNFVTYLQVAAGYELNEINFDNEYIALAALKANKIDAVISDTPILQYWIKQKGNEDFHLIDLPPYNKPFSHGRGYGIAIKKGNTELLKALNQAIKKVKASSTYGELVKKYFSDK